MSRSILARSFAVILFYASVVRADVVLIDASTNNGSFEAPAVAPWSGLFGTQLTRQSSPGFAFQGEAYAQLQIPADATQRAIANAAQLVTIDPTDGRSFLLSWMGRSATTNGFAGTMGLFGGPPLSALQFVENPSLQSDIWQRYVFTFTIADTWDGQPWRVGPSFRATGPQGTLFTGFVDDVRLTQLPEPMATFPSLASFLLIRRIRRRGRAGIQA